MDPVASNMKKTHVGYIQQKKSMLGILWLSAGWFRNDFGHYMEISLTIPISPMNSVAYAEICKHEYSQVLQIPCEKPFKHPQNLSDVQS